MRLSTLFHDATNREENSVRGGQVPLPSGEVALIFDVIYMVSVSALVSAVIKAVTARSIPLSLNVTAENCFLFYNLFYNPIFCTITNIGAALCHSTKRSNALKL